ncbi:hypothetical protein L1049_024382 [Liquidambar formosana]|uniref:Dolichyl-diphosphooligosaccharide-protein glycosyltransferase subunit OST5 n=1 Tax=Liquidambar formosana TaxID=63359 RepID=A0AAP0RVZ4_LIQFO
MAEMKLNPSINPNNIFLLKNNDLSQSMKQVKPISSPVPNGWYPTLSVLMLAIDLIVIASFFIYEANE